MLDGCTQPPVVFDVLRKTMMGTGVRTSLCGLQKILGKNCDCDYFTTVSVLEVCVINKQSGDAYIIQTHLCHGVWADQSVPPWYN